MITAVDIARHILKVYKEKGLGAINLNKLTKLTYIINGFYLALTENPLFSENAQVWKHGPVIPSVYYSFKDYPSALNHEIDLTKGESLIFDDKNIDYNLFQKIVNFVMMTFGKKSSEDIENWSHREGAPWYKLYNGKKNIDIPNDDVKSEFEELLKDIFNTKDINFVKHIFEN
jgi:uncharacterized phage-associated protein